jgi:hypothetical protein
MVFLLVEQKQVNRPLVSNYPPHPPRARLTLRVSGLVDGVLRVSGLSGPMGYAAEWLDAEPPREKPEKRKRRTGTDRLEGDVKSERQQPPAKFAGS